MTQYNITHVNCCLHSIDYTVNMSTGLGEVPVFTYWGKGVRWVRKLIAEASLFTSFLMVRSVLRVWAQNNLVLFSQDMSAMLKTL